MNHFLKPINQLEKSTENLNTFFNDLITDKSETDQKIEEIHKNILSQTEVISENLKDLLWSVQTLDKEKDCKILYKASEALEKLKTTTELMEKTALQKIPATLYKKIQELTMKTFDEALKLTNKKISTLNEQDELCCDKLCCGEWVRLPSSEKIPTPAPNLWSSISESIKKSFIYTPGKYFNPIPAPVSSYYQSVSQDSEDRKKDLISMIKGEMVNTQPAIFNSSSGGILDKNGQFVTVPHIFSVDLPRMETFRINKKEFDAPKEPNECARSIYSLFGREGGNRLMQICNQALVAFPLKKTVFPLIMDDEGVWRKMLPNRIILPSQESTQHFDINLDEEKSTVSINTKILMKLHPTEEENIFQAHFIMKTEITMNVAELTRNDFVKHDNPIPSLRVKETISTLIMDNRAEAMELFQKF